jgi:hypothetical protein
MAAHTLRHKNLVASGVKETRQFQRRRSAPASEQDSSHQHLPINRSK